MKKQIILFLMVLILGISLGQTFSLASITLSPTSDYCYNPLPPNETVLCPNFIKAYIYNNISLSNCFSTNACGVESCCYAYGTLTLFWYEQPTFNGISGIWEGGVWDEPDFVTSNDSAPGSCVYYAGQTSGSCVLLNANGLIFSPNYIANYVTQINNSASQGQGNYVQSGFSGLNSTNVWILSNVPQVINPPNAPFTGAPLVPPEDMTNTSDPINIATGEDYFSSTDFSFHGRGPKLDLFRKYRSFSTFNGMFGYGWRTDYDANLTTDSSGDVIIYDREGTGSFFMNYSGTYTPSPANYSTITKNTDGTYTVTDKHGIVIHYNINGRLSTRTDRNGNTLTFVYNPSVSGGTYIQDTSGRQIKLYFNSNGDISSAVDPAGKTFKYGYDANENLASIIDPTGAVTNYTYDSNHKIIQFTNANGHIRYYQYDSLGRCVMNWQNANVNKTNLNYQANNTTVVTDSLGNNRTYVFNDLGGHGLLTSYTDPLGNVTQQTWDPLMNLTSKTDARNNVTNYSYDGEGNLVQITDSLNNQTTMIYTPNFNLISTKTDALGNVTNFSYDNDGNLMSIIDALGNKHSFVYDQFGNVLTSTDSRGNSTNFTYDPLGHLIQKIDAVGNSTKFSYE